MTESIHTGMSPSVLDPESPILVKNKDKWEYGLLHILIGAVLLPPAAQSCSAGLFGLTFLFLGRWRFVDRQGELFQIFKTFMLMLAGLWIVLLISGLVDYSLSGHSKALKPFLNLIGKQGVWGCIIIAAIMAFQSRYAQALVRIRALLALAVALLLYCVVQRYTGIDWVHGFAARLGENRSDYGVYRVSGWMAHPLSFAFNLMLFALIAFAHSLYLKLKGDKEFKLWGALTALLLALMILTDSRYPLLLTFALMLGAGAWGFPRLRLKIFASAAALVVIAVILAFTLPHEALGRWGEFFDGTIPLEQRFDRIIFWKVNWQVFTQHPWFGAGLESYDSQLLDTYVKAGYNGLERKYNAHNIYLQTLADGGLIGEIGLALLLAAVGRLAFQVKKSFHHLALPLVFVATLGSGLVQNNLRDSEYCFALWTSIGLVFSWLIVQGRSNDPRARDQFQDLEP